MGQMVAWWQAPENTEEIFSRSWGDKDISTGANSHFAVAAANVEQVGY
jgi:hypothetical protein